MSPDLQLSDYLNIVRRRLWIVVSIFVTAIAIAMVWSALQTPLYRSRARILINQGTATEIFDPVSGLPVSQGDRIARNEVELLQSQLVRTEATQRLGFRAGISASAETRADVVVVSSVNAEPARAQLIAQTYAEAYLDVRRNEFSAERLASAEKLRERIAEIDAEIGDLPDTADPQRLIRLREDLADSFDRLTITAQLGNNGSARIIEDARRPIQPFVPRTRRNLVLGALLGLMAGVGAALLLETLDTSIKSRQVLDDLDLGVPTLGVIPAMKTDHAVIAIDKPDGSESEIFRSMRAALEFAAIDDRPQVIQVTSPGPSAGKTTVAVNLAVVMAQAGQRVAVLDADFRRPRVHSAFGLSQVPGLTSVIIGRETVSAASHALRLNNGALWVLPSGPIPPGPSELLGSERTQKMFASLRKSVDVIIVDSAPILPVADSLVLSRHVDATVMVASAKSTSRDDLARAISQLKQANASIIGIVLNQVKAQSLLGDGYGYGYGYGYGQAEPTVKLGRFGRKPQTAPRLEGTEVMETADLPRFHAARPLRLEENGASSRAGSAKAVAASAKKTATVTPLLSGENLWLAAATEPEPGDTDDPSSESVSKSKKSRSAKVPSRATTDVADDSDSDSWSDDISIRP